MRASTPSPEAKWHLLCVQDMSVRRQNSTPKERTAPAVAYLLWLNTCAYCPYVFLCIYISHRYYASAYMHHLPFIPPQHWGASLCTLSRRAFCQSLNIIMYVLSRAPKEVKKCWMGRDGDKNQFRKGPQKGKKKRQGCLDHFLATVHRRTGASHCSTAAQFFGMDWSSRRGRVPPTQGTNLSTATVSLEMCYYISRIFYLAPHPTSKLRVFQTWPKVCTLPFSLGASSEAPGSTSSQFGKIPQHTYSPAPASHKG